MTLQLKLNSKLLVFKFQAIKYNFFSLFKNETIPSSHKNESKSEESPKIKKRVEKMLQKEVENNKDIIPECVDLDQSEKMCCISVSSNENL